VTRDEAQPWIRQAEREKFEAHKRELKETSDRRADEWYNSRMRQQREERRVLQHHFIGGCFLITLFGILPAYCYLLKTWWLA
jgi:hypothetical protein